MAAGKNGFLVDKAVPEAGLRDRLVQRAWSSEWKQTGHGGGHHGIGLYEWNRRYVAPYLGAGVDDGGADAQDTASPLPYGRVSDWRR